MVVITLALGIGANTAIFSVVRGVLLKPLPHRDGDRLVYLRQSIDGPGGANIAFSVPEISDFRDGAQVAGRHRRILAVDAHAAGRRRRRSHQRRASSPATTSRSWVSRPCSAGSRGPSDDGPGRPAGHGAHARVLERHFGGDPGIVGKQVRLDGKLGDGDRRAPARAVLSRPGRCAAQHGDQPAPPERADGPGPHASHDRDDRPARARRHVEQATAEVAAVYARMQRDHQDAYDPGSALRVAVIPFKEVLGERARLTLWLLMGAAAFVLIISAANVANLTLMRGVRREHELVVRAALGAGVARLRRLLLVENLVLTLVGAGLGVLLAIGGVRLLTSLAERYSPRASEIRLDGVVLGFTLALAVASRCCSRSLASLPQGRHASRPGLPPGCAGSAAACGSSGCSGGWSSRRSPCRSCCSPAPDCSPAR